MQAVEEVAEAIIPFIEKNSKYQNKMLLERMIEPERVIIFRVTWLDDEGRRDLLPIDPGGGDDEGDRSYKPSGSQLSKFVGDLQVLDEDQRKLLLGFITGSGGDEIPGVSSEEYAQLFGVSEEYAPRFQGYSSLTSLSDDLQNIQIDIDYVSANNQSETMSLTFGLQYTVDNATTSETNENIRQNAPSTYYTQNRMITGEDYQVAPLGTNQEIVKIKSTNRTSSGISRYFDLIDSTGKYSNTNIFGADGSIYKEDTESMDTFSFATQTDIEAVILNKIEPLLSDKKTRNYYIEKFPKILLTDLNATWNQVTSATNLSTGKFTNSATSTNYQVGTFTASQMKYIEPGAMIKFEAPTGFHFMGNDNNKLMSGTADHPNSRTYVWTSVVSVLNDGVTNSSTGDGAIKLNDVIPSNAVATQILPKFSKQLSDDVKTLIIDQNAIDDYSREHATSYVYDKTDLDDIELFKNDIIKGDNEYVNWNYAVNDLEGFNNMAFIINKCGIDASLVDIISLSKQVGMFK